MSWVHGGEKEGIRTCHVRNAARSEGISLTGTSRECPRSFKGAGEMAESGSTSRANGAGHGQTESFDPRRPTLSSGFVAMVIPCQTSVVHFLLVSVHAVHVTLSDVGTRQMGTSADLLRRAAPGRRGMRTRHVQRTAL